MIQCPWIPEQILRFGDMHGFDALVQDGKLDQNGTGENVEDIVEAFKYTFSKPGKFCSQVLCLRKRYLNIVANIKFTN